MVVARRHLLLWYAINDVLVNFYRAEDTGAVRAPIATGTGPHAAPRLTPLSQNYKNSHVDPAGASPSRMAHLSPHNWTVTIVGVMER